MHNGRVALVTGASRGIGKAIASVLAKNGAIVVGTATTESGAASITSYLQELDSTQKSRGFVLDVGSLDSINNLISDVENNVGKIEILVNNAGITADNLFLRMKEEEWDRVISANLTGVFSMSKACIRHMIKNKWGRIINISSVVAFSGNPGQANYSAAKAGVVAMSKSIAAEVASRGITINVVAPGFIQTDMTGKLTNEQQEQLLERIPMKRMGQAEDIAQAVNFLSSEASSYITGETIHVNGGMLMN